MADQSIVSALILGLIEGLTEFIPFPVGAALVLLGGAPIFFNVIRAALKKARNHGTAACPTNPPQGQDAG